MLPSSTLKTICLSQGNFFALMGTTIALTAAATFWIVGRRSRSLHVSRYSGVSKASSTLSSSTVASSASTANATNATNLVSPDTSASPLFDDSLSYLCNSCGTEKYSPDQLAAVASGSSPYKMVILVRTDLNMGKGKVAAQCCHAVLAAFKSASTRPASGNALKKWEREGQPKITLKIDTESEMIELMNKARSAGIIAESIRDAGRTQVAAGTRTVCAIGPAPAKLIDTITGHLKLY